MRPKKRRKCVFEVKRDVCVQKKEGCLCSKEKARCVFKRGGEVFVQKREGGVC